jgi:preprotein translocase subunit SecD
LYLDDELVDSLFISEDLKGSDTTSFTIQGPGYGHTKQDAQIDATTNMRAMQTILISGSLPVGLEIAKMDVVSPALGDNFLNVALIALVAAVLAVGIVVFIRYRKIKIALPMVLTGLSEILIILGVAAAINWRLDLASIAGILAAVGTGVDDQIIITDEVLAGEHARSWKERLKRAFFIIFAAYFTTVVAMLPLWWMGAGLVKGFAVTTIIGVTIGVFLTRPAFAKVVEHLLKRGE